MRNLAAPVKREYVKPTIQKREHLPDGTEWRCPACNKDLFGKFLDGKLHIRYKDRDILADGILTTRCRRCGFSSKINTRAFKVNLVHSDNDDWLDKLVVLATPVAKNLAVTYNLDLSAIEGTGQDGRILKGDVLRVHQKSEYEKLGEGLHRK